MLTIIALGLLLVATTVSTSPTVGRIEEVDVTQQIKDAANFATNTINSENRQVESKWHTLFQINNPTRQVFDGMMYRMEIILKESECRNHENNNGASVTDCPPVAGGVTKKCNVHVWHRYRREPEYTLHKQSCSES